MDSLLQFLRSDFLGANWTGIIVPILIGGLSWVIGRSWNSVKSIRNYELSCFIGQYHAYHSDTTAVKDRKIVHAKVKIYRSIMGIVKIKLYQPGKKRVYIGRGYVISGVTYFKISDPHKKYEETMIFRNVITQDINVIVGIYAAVNMYQDPCCGIQVFSREELPNNVLAEILNNTSTHVISSEYSQTYSLKVRNSTIEIDNNASQ